MIKRKTKPTSRKGQSAATVDCPQPARARVLPVASDEAKREADDAEREIVTPPRPRRYASALER
jgi:hypothetical protein